MAGLEWPSALLMTLSGTPSRKLVESNVPTTMNTSAGAGRLEATLALVITGMDLPGHGAGPGQEPPPATGCTRVGDVRGIAARRGAAWLTGELAAAGNVRRRDAGMHEVQRERLVARSGA
jgi:hypothetical protein